MMAFYGYAFNNVRTSSSQLALEIQPMKGQPECRRENSIAARDLASNTTLELIDLVPKIREAVQNAEEHLRDSLRHALQAGESLCHAKRLVRHGKWTAWLESNQFDFGERTAQRYMRLFRKWTTEQRSLSEVHAPVALAELTMTSVLECNTESPESGGRPSQQDSSSGCPKTTELSDLNCSLDSKRQRSSGDDNCHPGISLGERRARTAKPGELTVPSSDDWQTPEHIVLAAQQVLGHIDLDPAADTACSIPAARHYTAAEDGLSRDNVWRGNVFLCPPIAEEQIARFVARLLREYESRNIDEALLIVPARTNQTWFRSLRTHMRAFIGKPKYGTITGMPEPIVVIYLGNRTNRFHAEFEEIGDCYVPFCAKHVRHLDKTRLHDG